jgi:hypothetical protein
VRELVTVIKELEDKIPPLTEGERKDWALLNDLQPELRTAVLREERTISTRTQVQAAAKRLQELGVVRPPAEATRGLIRRQSLPIGVLLPREGKARRMLENVRQ